MRVKVIGAGVTGLACATALAERSIEVEVNERSDGVGAPSASWLGGGMLAPWCELESAEEPVARLGQEAVAWWSGRVPGVVREGTLVVAPARDVGELQRFARRTGHFEWLDGDGIAALEPDLAGRFGQALFFPGGGAPRSAWSTVRAVWRPVEKGRSHALRNGRCRCP